MEYDLAFEGGGAKGVVFIGALMEFEARGHTARRFVGTSAGSITAALVAAGYRAAELERAVTERLPDGTARLETFLDIPDRFRPEEVRASEVQALFDHVDIPLLPAAAEERIERGLLDGLLQLGPFRMLFSLIEKGGLYAGDRCRTWIEDKLDAVHPGLGVAGFAEFHRRTGSDLSITVSDITGEELLVLNVRTAPDCPVAWAVRASMSIPFVFQEVLWRAEWGRYRGRDLAGHALIDGGVLSNFPIKLLASNLAEIREIMGDTDPYAVPNLGLLIDEALPVDGGPAEPGGGVVGRAVRSKPVLRFERIVETLLNAHDRAIIEACLANHEICRLPAKGYSAIDFGMSDARVHALIEAGRRATRDHFDHRRAGG